MGRKKLKIKRHINDFKTFDIIIFTVPHKDFKSLNVNQFSKKNFILDTNRCLEKKLIKNLIKNKIKLKLIGNKNFI